MKRDALIEVIARALRPEDFWNEFADYPTRSRVDWETGQQVARIEAEPIVDALLGAVGGDEGYVALRDLIDDCVDDALHDSEMTPAEVFSTVLWDHGYRRVAA